MSARDDYPLHAALEMLNGHLTEGGRSALAELDAAREQLGQLTGEILDLLDLLECFVDNEACSFDHHGACQAHGYLGLEPGEICPQQQAKDILRVRS